MRVLVVDDEKAVADSTILVFRQFGYEAEAVYSAEEALAAVQHLHPDLLVADVMMSGMNGIELAIRLCDEMPHCKTLLFSGQADTANLLEEARQRGFEFEILAKPVLPAELIDKAVQLAGEGRQDELEPEGSSSICSRTAKSPAASSELKSGAIV